MNGIDRLLTLQAENRAAGERMQLVRPRFNQLALRHENGTAPKAITAFNLFQTPRPVAALMSEIVRAYVKPGARILEPSAGLGRLYEPFEHLDELRENWLMIENAGECVRALKAAIRRLDIQERDFMQTSPDKIGTFDAVIMNPPFKQGTDIKHIKHAVTMLNPGGVLVSLCYNGSKQNAELRPIANTWEVLPEKSFKEEGTSASVALIVITKELKQ